MAGKMESGDAMVGRIVQKSFDGFGIFMGKVVAYDSVRGFYKIKYEDGDAEELDLDEVYGTLLPDCEADGELSIRKRKLEDSVQQQRKRGRPRKKRRGRTGGKQNGKVDDSFQDVQFDLVQTPNEDKITEPGSGNGGMVRDSICEEKKRKRKRQNPNCDSPFPAGPVKRQCRTRKNPYSRVSPARVSPSPPASAKRQRRTRKKPCSGVSPDRMPRMTLRSARKPAVHKYTTSSGSEAEEGNVSSPDESYVAAYQDALASASEDSEGKDSGRCRGLDALECSKDAADQPLPPMQPLPPSSNDLAVPEQSIADLFSVYGCLRSFSKLLFLSPFGLEEFVGALNCKSANSLLDCVHVSLLRALRRHLEFQSTEGSASATACLRHLDWDFMDAVTWPVYVVEYLVVKGFSKKTGHKVGRLRLLDGEYYTIAVSIKLTVLQFLCDDVMETEEIRAEINMRVNSEPDIDGDGRVDSFLGGSVLFERQYGDVKRKISTRLSEKSKKVDLITKPDEQGSSISSQVTIERSSSVRDDTILQGNPNCFQIDAGGKPKPIMNGVKDWNGDECCLCGMDGRLICCDGCPAAYHSRCVGVLEAHLPEGDWYCPECLVSKGDKGLQALKGLQGAEIFGIDPYGRAYFAVCGYLLVSNSALHPDATYKYYNGNDVTKVLEILRFSGPLGDGIQNAILQYWDIPKHGNGEVKDNASTMGPLNLMKPDAFYERCPFGLSDLYVSQFYVQQEEGSGSVLRCQSSKEEKIIKKMPSSQEVEGAQNSDAMGYKMEHEMVDMDQSNDNVTLLASSEGSVEITSVNMNGQRWLKSSEQKPTDFEANRIAGCSDELARYSSSQEQQLSEVDADSSTTVQVESMGAGSLQGQQLTRMGASKSASQMDVINNIPNGEANFKPNAYINQYVLGDMAASAAANLTVKAAEENKGRNGHGASKKSPSTTASEQIKVFSKAAVQFCWPSCSKELMGVPKERCGWCFQCKSFAGDNRSCLLNVATGYNMAGAVRVSGGLRPTKNGDGHLPSVAAYILYIEGQLHGLMDGPWKNPYHRKYWRKRVEQASSVTEVKYSMLELESNVRHVAFATCWFKPVDDSSTLVPSAQIVSSVDRPTAKRSGSVKQAQKQTVFAGTIATPKDIRLFLVDWWRGGRLSDHVYFWKVLPRTVARKAGRQAGFRRIDGVFYSEGSEIPRRSRRYAWRAAVEMAGSVPELAVQVRNLDASIRWDQIVKPGKFHQSDRVVHKGAAALKNAVIRSKSFEGGVVKYLMDFGKRKAIPMRIGKYGERAAETLDGRNKYWVSEAHVPLYMLKDYEERLLLHSSPNKNLKQFCKGQRRLLQNPKKEKFSFLLTKTEECEKCLCSQCNMDVLIRKAVQCQTCQGSFHSRCTVASSLLDKMECKNTCYKCHSAKFPESKLEKLKKQSQKCCTLMFEGCQRVKEQVKENGKSLGVQKAKGGKRGHLLPREEHVARNNYGSVDMHMVQRKKYDTVFRSSGLLWKKNRVHHLGEHFREKKILCPSSNSIASSVSPKCFLCREAYNSKLIYIGCEYCKEWYHGDTFGLTMENIVELVGFKCHKCRKRSTPVCPYARRDKLWIENLNVKGRTDESEVIDVASNRKPLDVIYSRSRRVSEEELQAMLAGEKCATIESTSQTDSDYVRLTAMVDNNGQVSQAGKNVNSACSSANPESLSLKMSLDPSATDYLADDVKCYWQDQTNDEMREMTVGSLMMNIEPIQTYSGITSRTTLSFTELLASEDDRVEDLVDLSQDIDEKWSDSLQSADKGVNTFSQLHGIECSQNHSCGVRISANDTKNIGCQLENGVLTGNVADQTFGTGTMVRSEETKTKCTVCTSREVPPDNHCGGCGIAIHSCCYEWAPTGVWTACGWICNDCHGALVQGQGTFPCISGFLLKYGRWRNVLSTSPETMACFHLK